MKTTLKTAKFTLKTVFARFVAANAVVVSCISVAKVAKLWCDCGGWWCGCGGFYVLFRQLQGLFAVKILCCGGGFMIDCGMFYRGCGGFYVFFRRLQGLFAVKMRCGNGENMVRKWRNGGAEMAKLRCIFGVYMLDFLHFCCQGGEMVVLKRRLRGAFLAFPTLISRISQSIPPFSPPFYGKSASYINISHLPKPPYRNSNRRKQC